MDIEASQQPDRERVVIGIEARVRATNHFRVNIENDLGNFRFDHVFFLVPSKTVKQMMCPLESIDILTVERLYKYMDLEPGDD